MRGTQKKWIRSCISSRVYSILSDQFEDRLHGSSFKSDCCPDPGVDLCVLPGTLTVLAAAVLILIHILPVHGSDGSNGSTFCDLCSFLFPIYSGDVHDRAARYGSVSF